MPPHEVGEAFIAIRASTARFAEEARTEVRQAVRQASGAATIPLKGNASHEQVSGEVRAATRGVSASVPVHANVNREQIAGEITSSFRHAATQVVGAVGGIFAAEKIFEFGADVVREAAGVQKAQQSIRQEYGETSEKVLKFGENQATAFGISNEASAVASARIGALLTNLGYGPEKAAAMDLGLQRVVGSMAAMRNIDPSSVLARLNTTLATGSTRGLRDLGVALDSASIKAEAMRLHLIPITHDSTAVAAAQIKEEEAQRSLNQAIEAHGRHSIEARAATVALAQAHNRLASATSGVSGTMTVAAKDQAIYSLITRQSGDALAAARQHSGDLANEQRILSAEWQNAKAAIGEALLPAVTALVGVLLQGVTVIREHRTEFVALATVVGTAASIYFTAQLATKAWEGITAISRVTMALFRGQIVLATAAQRAKTVADTVAAARQAEYTAAMEGGALASDAQAAATQAATVAQEELDAAMVANPIGLVIAAVAILAGGLYELYEHSATARRIMNEMFHDLEVIGGGALHGIGVGIGVIVDLIHGDWGAAWATVRDAASSAIGAAEGALDAAVPVVTSAARRVGSAIVDAVVGQARALPGHLADLLSAAPGAASGALRAAAGAAGAIGGDAAGAAAGALSGVGGAVSNALSPVTNIIREVSADVRAVWDDVWSNFGAPVRLAIRLVRGQIEDIANIVTNTINLVQDIITGRWGAAWHDVTEIVASALAIMLRSLLGYPALIASIAITIGRAVWRGIGGEVRRLPGQLADLLSDAWGALRRADRAASAAAGRLGLAVLRGVIGEARRLPGQVWGIVTDLARLEIRGITTVLDGARRIGGAIIRGVLGEARALPGQVIGLIRRAVLGYVALYAWVFREAEHLGAAIVRGAISEARRLPGQVTSLIHRAGRDIASLGGWIFDQAVALGRRLVRGAIRGVGSLGGDLKDAIENKVRNALSDLNPFSPVEHGGRRFIADPIISGATSGLGPLGGAIGRAIMRPLRQVMFGAQEQGIQLSHDLGTDIWRNIVNALDPLRSHLRAVWAGVLSDINRTWPHISGALGTWVASAIHPVNTVLSGIGAATISAGATRAARGGIFPAIPGGLLHIVEGGHPETVISHDPQHRDRSLGLIAETLKRIGVRRPTERMIAHLDRDILPDRSIPMAAGGVAAPASNAAARALAEALRMSALHRPYLWGGGHATFSRGGPWDCSGSVSEVLRASGVPIPFPMVSGMLASYGAPGPGALEWFANSGHVYMAALGRFFGTSSYNPGGGFGPLPYGARPGFAVRHYDPAGMGGLTAAQLLAGGYAPPFGGDPAGYLRQRMPDLPPTGPARNFARLVAAAAQQRILAAVARDAAASLPGVTTGGGGDARSYARSLFPAYGWGQEQWAPLNALWNRESGWRWNARNPTSGAYGIPQSLPGSKMASAGPDWRTNYKTQVRWGEGYIHGRFGTPAGAWAHSQATGWYDDAGAGTFLPGARGAHSPFRGAGGELVVGTHRFDRGTADRFGSVVAGLYDQTRRGGLAPRYRPTEMPDVSLTPDQVSLLGQRHVTIQHLHVHADSAEQLMDELTRAADRVG